MASKNILIDVGLYIFAIISWQNMVFIGSDMFSNIAKAITQLNFTTT